MRRSQRTEIRDGMMNIRKIAAWLHLWLGIVSAALITVICATGALYGLREYIRYDNEDFWTWVLDGHCFLWLPLPYGRIVTGCTALTFLVILISGVIMQWPGRWTANAVRKRLWFSGPLHTKRMLMNLHLVLGLWVLLPLTVLCLTGMLMAFDWFRDFVFLFVPEDKQMDLMILNSEIHDGSIIGHAGRMIMLASAITGATLPVTGLIMYIRRKLRANTGKRQMV
ncbi:MAG: PepSY domain-containing protein [Bacteroidaceae bacterium]|nr:PepSY domain-containing protein [Bacteroidaceae bacterium]